MPDGIITCELTNRLAKSIRSIALSPDLKQILIGTYGSEIHELFSTTGAIDKTTKFENEAIRMTGHYTPC